MINFFTEEAKIISDIGIQRAPGNIKLIRGTGEQWFTKYMLDDGIYSTIQNDIKSKQITLSDIETASINITLSELLTNSISATDKLNNNSISH